MDGTTVTLAWRAEGSLDVIEYLVEVGSTPGGSDIYNAPVGTQTSVSATVSSGSYFARVRARTPGDSSVLSNEVGFAVGESGCSAMPKTPREPSGSIAAGVATLRWKHAGGATSFIVQAGTAPGRSNLFNGDVGSTRTVTANVPVGLPIYARVIAVNACAAERRVSRSADPVGGARGGRRSVRELPRELHPLALRRQRLIVAPVLARFA